MNSASSGNLVNYKSMKRDQLKDPVYYMYLFLAGSLVKSVSHAQEVTGSKIALIINIFFATDAVFSENI